MTYTATPKLVQRGTARTCSHLKVFGFLSGFLTSTIFHRRDPISGSIVDSREAAHRKHLSIGEHRRPQIRSCRRRDARRERWKQQR